MEDNYIVEYYLKVDNSKDHYYLTQKKFNNYVDAYTFYLNKADIDDRTYLIKESTGEIICSGVVHPILYYA